jgi:hypothetical protein
MKHIISSKYLNMKRKLYLFALIFSASVANAQHDHNRCLTDIIYQQQLKDDPSALQRAAEFERQYQEEVQKYATTQRKSEQKLIVPVVFHIFHNNGVENISKAQIQNQIDSMNMRFNDVELFRLRPIFWGVAATCEIEFRLASIDPWGNCTDGIVRIYDPETENGTNNIKYKSAWPTDKYLNIWVVREINSTTSSLGTTLGYAQFPWFGVAATDGIVIRDDNVGSIGTGANPRVGVQQWGRTLIHEAGHWLGLYHPFQDSCSGGDFVEDTPPVASANFGCNYSRNSCPQDDLPDMIENYMDYADGPCMSVFTIQQKIRMHTSLKNWRPKLISNSNLVATGTADPYTPGNCGPVASFYSLNRDVCPDGTVSFINDTYNTEAAGVSYLWEFPGGTPATAATLTPPAIKYTEPGLHDVRLITSKTVGGTVYTDTLIREEYVRVFNSTGEYGAGYTEGFEHSVFPVNGWSTRSTSAQNFKRRGIEAGSIEGNFALYVENTPGEVGASFFLESPSFDISMVSDPYISFYYAFAQRRQGTSGTADGLIVSASSDCGKTWRPLYTSQPATFPTNGTIGGASPYVTVSFIPSGPEQWKSINAAITGTIIPAAQRNNVRFRFEFRSRGGNNFYIDQINIGFPANIKEHFSSEANFNVYPNPSSGNAKVELNLIRESEVRIDVLDMFGRQVSVLADKSLTEGSHSFDFSSEGKNLSNGMYIVRMTVDGDTYSRKLLITGNN